MFLESTGLGRKVIKFARNDAVFTQGDPAKNVIVHSGGRCEVTVVNEPGREAVGSILGPGDFFGGRPPGGSVHSHSDRVRAHDRAEDWGKKDDSGASRRTRFFRPLHRLHVDSKRSSRRRPHRPALQFQRETNGADLAHAGALWIVRRSSQDASGLRLIRRVSQIEQIYR